MSKKAILVLVVLAVALLVGGYFAFQQYQEAERRAAYEVSSDRVADETVAAIARGDVNASRNHFSRELKANYSDAFWKTTIFAEIQGYKGTPKLNWKGAVGPASATAPNRYDPRLNQQATQFEYDFAINNATYRVTLVVFRQDNAWKVNELSGGYLPS